ncbi:MAG TPA: DNA-processing protein DprA [Caulobacteraceae bacterium]|nr:DNA-processing protein DprA [Caulobacteraceae bacterium]
MAARVLSAEERIDWLRLARSPSVGPVAFAHLIARYGAAGAALDALPALARRGGRTGPLDIPSRSEAQAELDAGQKLGARFVAACEPAFPRPLAALDAPPPLIWVFGDAGLLERRAVAIVGSREASAAGQRLARTLAADLGEAGYVVVSGLARGIDAAAHQGALPFGTIAVMAGGVDHIYPPQNETLYAAIRERGCIASERRIGHIAKAQDFPRRNRLISGLTLGVVVVEAELRSGSLITARLAGEQGREVFAVPGSPLDPRARGTNGLIRQGAALVESAEDVLRELESLGGVQEPAAEPSSPPLDLQDDEIDAVRDRLLGVLSPTPTSIDELARAAETPTQLALAALMELALAGRAQLLPGGLAAVV